MQININQKEGVRWLRIKFEGPVFDWKVKKVLHTKLVKFLKKNEFIHSTRLNIETHPLQFKTETELWEGNTFTIPFHTTFAFRQLLFDYFQLESWYTYADLKDRYQEYPDQECTMTWRKNKYTIVFDTLIQKNTEEHETLPSHLQYGRNTFDIVSDKNGKYFHIVTEKRLFPFPDNLVQPVTHRCYVDLFYLLQPKGWFGWFLDQ
tara:strand:+ start:895 stop:1509 length:615 start_codon:yes stop_codon:yes gene_type:complete